MKTKTVTYKNTEKFTPEVIDEIRQGKDFGRSINCHHTHGMAGRGVARQGKAWQGSSVASPKATNNIKWKKS